MPIGFSRSHSVLRAVHRSGSMQRPVACVPRLVMAGVFAALAAQIAFQLSQSSLRPSVQDLPPAPAAAALRLGSLGDPVPLAKVLALYLQSFDYRAAHPLPFQHLDYERLTAWLGRLLQLDPAGQYPLMLASRVYAEAGHETKQRQMMDFVYEEFLKDPQRRWPWLAHVAIITKHRLKDLSLARHYAAAIQQHAGGAHVPLWARQMEAFILEDMDELEAARVMIGGFIAKGMVKDPAERRFLEQRLLELERRLGLTDDGTSPPAARSRRPNP
jgi:hypothetical protein